MIVASIRLIVITIVSFFLTFSRIELALAQDAYQVEDAFLATSFNEMPAFTESGQISASPELNSNVGYTVSRTWDAGTPVSDVVKVGDIDSGLQASQLSLSQISELTGIDLDEVSINEVGFFNDVSVNELLNDIPFLGEWSLEDLNTEDFNLTNYLQDELGLSGITDNSTLNSILGENPQLGDLNVNQVLGEFNVTDIPNLELAQLSSFSGISDEAISQIPGLGDIDLGQFNQLLNTDKLAGLINFFPLQDIAFEEREYHSSKPTPQPVSGGTNGSEKWEPIACSGGCAHVELHGDGWKGANWMTKAHRVRDGFGVLGGIVDKAGAYRLPFGHSFALQIAKTDEKTGAAEWGIAFRICKRGFIDLGCTAYFMEVPLGITTYEGQHILAGARDLRGGSTQPIDAPPGWEYKRPDTPPDIAAQIGEYFPTSGGGSGLGSAPVVMDEDCLQGLLAATPTSQVEGAAKNIPVIIEAANKYGLSADQTAYVLATVRAEVGGYGWDADIEEYGKPCDYDGGCGWHGRGYVQLTHKSNYQFVGDQIGIDLVSDPDKALQTDVAAEVLVAGIKNGWYNGQGHGIDHYINDQQQDWTNARRTVNVLDKADTIGGWAQEYAQALGQCSTLETTRGEIGSPLGGVSLQDAINYQPTPGQSFTAYREYRDGYHAGIDFDSSIGAGAGAPVTSVTGGEIREIRYIASDRVTGEGSLSVRIVSTDSDGRRVEQRYTHLSESSVREALGVGPGEGAGIQIAAGQSIGQVGGTDTVSTGAHLDYKVIVDGQFSDPQQFLQAVVDGGGTLDTISVSTGARGQTQVGGF